jgi:hypothetical protein
MVPTGVLLVKIKKIKMQVIDYQILINYLEDSPSISALAFYGGVAAKSW